MIDHLNRQISSSQAFDANLRDYRRSVEEADREANVAVTSIRRLFKEHDNEKELVYLTQDAILRVVGQIGHPWMQSNASINNFKLKQARSLQQKQASYANDLKRAGKN